MTEPDPSPIPAEWNWECVRCGQPLRGLTSDRCPECGERFERTFESRIPWVRRREIGRVRAFLSTLWMVLYRPSAFALEARRPVDVRSAEQFRSICLALASVGALLGAVAVVLNHNGLITPFPRLVSEEPSAPWYITAEAVGLGVGAWLALRVLGWVTAAQARLLSGGFPHKHRAASLAAYGMGPAALLPIGAICSLIAGAFAWYIDRGSFDALMTGVYVAGLVAGATAAVLSATGWISGVLLLRGLSGARPGAVVTAAIVGAVVFAATAAAALVVPPAFCIAVTFLVRTGLSV